MLIIFTIVLLFIVMGIVIAPMNAEFDSSYSSPNIEGVSSQFSEDQVSGTSGWAVLKSVLLMFLWSFGSIPLWFELIFIESLRILLYITVARNIWIGGGG